MTTLKKLGKIAALTVFASLAFGQNAALMPTPKIQFLDQNGFPLSGGLVYTCQSGSSCPGTSLPTYTDATAGVPNSNPVVLDAGGFAPIWLGSSTYKIVVQTSAGVTISTTDNVTNNGFAQKSLKCVANGYACLDSAAFVPQAELNYTQGATGSVNRTVQNRLQEVVSVRDFGAVGNGSTDDTAAFNAALTALGTTGGKLRIPAGQYKLTSTLTLQGPTIVEGVGNRDSCSTAATCLTFSAGVSGFVVPVAAWGSAFRDFYLKSASTIAGSDNGILIHGQFVDIHNLTISGFGNDGVSGDSTSPWNTDHLVMDHVYLNSNKRHGFYCTGGDCNVQVLNSVSSYSNGGWGFYYNSGAANSLNALDATANALGGYYLGGIGFSVIMPYCEAGAAMTLAGTDHYVTVPLFGACTINNSGGPSNLILTGNGIAGGFSLLPNPGTASPVQYRFRNGIFGAGQIDFVDLTNSAGVFAASKDFFNVETPTLFTNNVSTTGTIGASGTITGANLSTAGTLSVTGAVTAGSFTGVKIPSIKATTGTRYLCIDTSGNITSSATACSGT